jgi:hypothetical protein
MVGQTGHLFITPINFLKKQSIAIGRETIWLVEPEAAFTNPKPDDSFSHA